jgi:hypothetical protein
LVVNIKFKIIVINCHCIFVTQKLSWDCCCQHSSSHHQWTHLLFIPEQTEVRRCYSKRPSLRRRLHQTWRRLLKEPEGEKIWEECYVASFQKRGIWKKYKGSGKRFDITMFEIYLGYKVWNSLRTQSSKTFLNYSQTWSNDHFWIATICLQQPQFWDPILNLYSEKLPHNKDHLSTTATSLGFQGLGGCCTQIWLYTKFKVTLLINDVFELSVRKKFKISNYEVRHLGKKLPSFSHKFFSFFVQI